MQNKMTLIRTIYLYLFSVVGLVLVVISGVRFIDMGLKAWVFTKADQQDIYRQMPPTLAGRFMEPGALEQKISNCGDKCNLTAEEQKTIQGWVAEYQYWKENQKEVNYITQQRHRDAANSLAMLIVGLPLYLYHWRLATKKRKEEE